MKHHWVSMLPGSLQGNFDPIEEPNKIMTAFHRKNCKGKYLLQSVSGFSLKQNKSSVNAILYVSSRTEEGGTNCS